MNVTGDSSRTDGQRRVPAIEQLESRWVLSAGPLILSPQSFQHDPLETNSLQPADEFQHRHSGRETTVHGDRQIRYNGDLRSPGGTESWSDSLHLSFVREDVRLHQDRLARHGRDTHQGGTNRPRQNISLEIANRDFNRPFESSQVSGTLGDPINHPVSRNTNLISANSIPGNGRGLGVELVASVVSNAVSNRLPERVEDDRFGLVVRSSAAGVDSDQATSDGTELETAVRLVALSTADHLTNRLPRWIDFDVAPSHFYELDSSSESPEIDRWLRDSSRVREQLDELDQALQELMEEQSKLFDISPIPVGGMRPNRVLTESSDASIDWLDRADELLLAPQISSAVNLTHFDLEPIPDDAVVAGWTVEIGMHQAFESSLDSSEFVLTSVETPLAVAVWKPEQTESIEDDPESRRQPIIPVIAVVMLAIGIGLRRRSDADHAGQTC